MEELDHIASLGRHVSQTKTKHSWEKKTEKYGWIENVSVFWPIPDLLFIASLTDGVCAWQVRHGCIVSSSQEEINVRRIWFGEQTVSIHNIWFWKFAREWSCHVRMIFYKLSTSFASRHCVRCSTTRDLTFFFLAATDNDCFSRSLACILKDHELVAGLLCWALPKSILWRTQPTKPPVSQKSLSYPPSPNPLQYFLWFAWSLWK